MGRRALLRMPGSMKVTPCKLLLQQYVYIGFYFIFRVVFVKKSRCYVVCLARNEGVVE